MEIIRHYREIEESGILRIVCSDTPEQILTSSGYEYLSDIYADVLDGSASQERIDEYNQIIDYFKQNRISGIEVEFNTTGLDIDIVGRTEGIGMAEKSAGLQYEREMVWVDGAPDTEGVIILPHDDYDKVYVVKGTKEAPQVIFINDDPTVRPYYEKKDGKTYIYMEGFSGGGGTQSDPYLVSSLSDLNNVRNNLAAYYLQTIDIDGGSTTFTPIGTSTTPFTGSYDGSGYSINNLIMSGAGYRGIFGYTSGASINHIYVNNITITSTSNYSGALIGYALNTNVYNCHGSLISVNGGSYNGGLVGYFKTTVTGKSFQSCSMSGYVTGVNYIGGLIGDTNGNCLIQSNSSSATVQASSSSAGGIIGWVESGPVTIQYNANSGSIKAANFAGGIVGYAAYHNITSWCWNTGDVEATGQAAGGIIGYNSTQAALTGGLALSNCYNTGVIKSPYYAGGIVGQVYSSGSGSYLSTYSIDKCYNSGNIYGQNYAGGILGSVGQSYSMKSSSLSNCYSLGDSITRTSGTALTFGRILGGSSSVNWPTLSNNYAREDMVFYP